jgi:TolB-like protein
MITHIRAVLLLLLVPLLFQCASTTEAPLYHKDGKTYGRVEGTFRHRWWNYYERGLSYAEGAYFEEALADLMQAVAMRAEDQRRARTYGMHFVDYFPNREIGVVQFQMGRLPEAQQALEISIAQQPTAKARYYLDRVRQSLLRQRKPQAVSPRIRLDRGPETLWTREDPITIAGTARDENYVAAVSINGIPQYQEGAAREVAFESKLDLPEGRHVIPISATNLLGAVTQQSQIIFVDRQGPQIIIDQIKQTQATVAGAFQLQGWIYDGAGLSALFVNGLAKPIPQQNEIILDLQLPADHDRIELLARDRLGNETKATVSLPKDRADQDDYYLLALADSSAENLRGMLVAASETKAPLIRLSDWSSAQTVYLEKIYLEGEVSDQTTVASLTLNGLSILRRPGQRIFFGQTVDLAEGDNRLLIEARNQDGQLSRHEIVVTRMIPKALQLSERLSVSVMPFEQKTAVSEIGLAFQDNLIDALVDRDRFQVVERNLLEQILAEQQLSLTQLVDEQTALEMGRLVAAESILSGSIIETRNGIEIVARWIDTETSEVLLTTDVYDEKRDLPALRDLARGMALKVHRAFPLIGGTIVQCKGNDIFTDLGQDRIKLKRRLLVYREEPILHPLTGRRLGADNTILAQARVTQVMPELSKARLQPASVKGIQALDKVITK